VSFAAITFCVASQQVFIVLSIYLIINSVWKLLNIPSYIFVNYKNTYSVFVVDVLLCDGIICVSDLMSHHFAMSHLYR
jgi:hypothetical protein